MAVPHVVGLGSCAVTIGIMLMAFCGQPASAASFDCEQAHTPVEEMICADGTLDDADRELSDAYLAALAAADKRERTVLVAEQRKWLGSRATACKISSTTTGPDDPKIRCLQKLIEDRTEKLLSSLRPIDPKIPKPFEGYWERCQMWQGQRICGYHQLYQSGDRVCGYWHYWATFSGYDGQLAAIADGLIANVQASCGRPGSDAQHSCPGTGIEKEEHWDAQSGRLLICAGRLYALDSARSAAPCSGRQLEDDEVRRNLTPSEALEAHQNSWLHKCLADDKFPGDLPEGDSQ